MRCALSVALCLWIQIAYAAVPNSNWEPNDYDGVSPSTVRLLEEQAALRVDFTAWLSQQDITWLDKEMGVRQIDRYNYGELSLKDFYDKYAIPGIPVVVSNYSFSTVPWTLEHFRTKCGDKEAVPKRSSRDSDEWGRLVHMDPMTIRDFIDTYARNWTDPDGAKAEMSPPYVFDWGIPGSCPEIIDEFIVPKYFAQDYLQRTSTEYQLPHSSYRNSWPSLFIGPKGCQSSMHVDSFGSNFWMGQLEGQKHWRIFPHSHHYLYEESGYTFEVDPLKPDYTTFPLLRKAIAWDAIIGPGDAIYVPAQSPHKVHSLTDTVSISMNYVDFSNMNVSRAMFWEDQDPHNIHFMNILAHPDFPRDIDYELPDQPWKDYKKPAKQSTWFGDELTVITDNNATDLLDLWERQVPVFFYIFDESPLAAMLEPKIWKFAQKMKKQNPSIEFFRVRAGAMDSVALEWLLSYESTPSLIKWRKGDGILLALNYEHISNNGFEVSEIESFWDAPQPDQDKWTTWKDPDFNGMVFAWQKVRKYWTSLDDKYDGAASEAAFEVWRVVMFKKQLYAIYVLLVWIVVAIARGLIKKRSAKGTKQKQS